MTNNNAPSSKEDKEEIGNKGKDMVLEEVKEDKLVKKRKWTKYSKRDKLEIYSKTLKLLSEGKSMARIALAIKVPRKTIYDLLSSDELFASYKKRQKEVLDVEYAKLALQTAREARKRLLEAPEKLKFKDVVVAGAIAHDKIYPPFTQAQQFNISGQDMKVEMPQFFKPRKTHSHTGDSS